MTRQEPSFYLRSSEYDTWSALRACWKLGSVAGPRPRGYWHVRVDPPVPGSLCGSMTDQTELLLAERYAGMDLETLGDQVAPVYVCAIRNPSAVGRGVVSEQDMELVAWAEVARDPAALA
jgi:hypothetical protein